MSTSTSTPSPQGGNLSEYVIEDTHAASLSFHGGSNAAVQPSGSTVPDPAWSPDIGAAEKAVVTTLSGIIIPPPPEINGVLLLGCIRIRKLEQPGFATCRIKEGDVIMAESRTPLLQPGQFHTSVVANAGSPAAPGVHYYIMTLEFSTPGGQHNFAMLNADVYTAALGGTVFIHQKI